MKLTLSALFFLFIATLLNAQSLEDAPDAAKLFNEGTFLRQIW
jgi:hypothetical protein